MTIRPGTQKWLAVLLVVSIALTLMIACGGGTGAPADDVDMVADGRSLLEGPCTQCHNLERSTGKSKTRDEWLATVDRMVGKGAAINAEEKEVLVDYLAEEYGP